MLNTKLEVKVKERNEMVNQTYERIDMKCNTLEGKLVSKDSCQILHHTLAENFVRFERLIEEMRVDIKELLQLKKNGGAPK